jgi:hypothetical protein
MTAPHDPMCTDSPRKVWLSDREYRIVCDCDLIDRVRSEYPTWPELVAQTRAAVAEEIAQALEAKFGHLGPFHPYFEFAPLAASIARDKGVAK